MIMKQKRAQKKYNNNNLIGYQRVEVMNVLKGNTFVRCGAGLCSRVESSRKQTN